MVVEVVVIKAEVIHIAIDMEVSQSVSKFFILFCWTRVEYLGRIYKYLTDIYISSSAL